MERSLSFRPRSRILPAFLAACLVVVAVAEAVHTHGLGISRAGQPSVGLQAAGSSQTGVCLACLAAHSPAPAAAAPIVLSSPQDSRDVPVQESERSYRTTAPSILPSRAPPALSTNQA
jgi:hypothetical protein